jgi:hypothetical protein
MRRSRPVTVTACIALGAAAMAAVASCAKHQALPSASDARWSVERGLDALEKSWRGERIPGLPWLAKLSCIASVLLLGSACRSPRSISAWNEQTLCQCANDWAMLKLVDEQGHGIGNAWVWTEARLREGAMGYGETIGWYVLQRGPASTSNEEGDVHVCDIARPLVREYGATGWQSVGIGGSAWMSVVEVQLRVEVAGQDRARVSHFFSAGFGREGSLVPLPLRIVVRPAVHSELFPFPPSPVQPP